MGGRGSSSGTSVKGKKYGTEYRSLLTYQNIKFIVQRDQSHSLTAPMETMTRGRIYALIDEYGNIKSIDYYDNDNKRFKQIDLTHEHKIRGIYTKPHIHHGYNHAEYESSKSGASNLSSEEWKIVYMAKNVWKGRKHDVWTNTKYDTHAWRRKKCRKGNRKKKR